MIVGNLHGMFVVWRSPLDKETIKDWGIYQFPLEAHPMGYHADIVCETRVPIFGTADGVIMKDDMLRAKEILSTALVDMIRTRSEFRRIRDQFGRMNEKRPETGGRPKPEVELVDDAEFARIWSQAVLT